MRTRLRARARESLLTARARAEAGEAPRRLSTKDRRVFAWSIALILLGGYIALQVIGLATTKDAVPPSWVIALPAGATIVGEPRIDYEPFRSTTYLTVRPAEGQKPHQLVEQMGLGEQPTQLGPTPLDWRPLWVYSRPTPDGVELRLVYRRDSSDEITPEYGTDQTKRYGFVIFSAPGGG